jgi:hypothetical protein
MILQGFVFRHSCAAADFPPTLRVRSLPVFASKGWTLLSWSTVERYAITFRSLRTITPAAAQAIREFADDLVFLMQRCLPHLAIS